MSFIVLPIEIIIDKILILLSINDLVEFSKTCISANEYVLIYLKCNNCKSKIQEKQDIYKFKTCHECKKIICKNCQIFCNNYEYCDNIFCENCLVTELCEECEEYLQNTASDEDY
jgi:hypothetical protein